MVMPIGDDNSDRRLTPIVNYAIIALNVLVFIGPQGMGDNDKFTYAYSCVPEEIVTGKDIVTKDEELRAPDGRTYVKPGLQPTPLVALRITLLTSIFMHGSFAHLFGNMLFLWIFGDNVEDRLGHVRYVVFYFLMGILASLAHIGVTYASHADPQVPSLGASGAISGVLGGYILLFPKRRVTVILFRILTQVPAYVAIGIWFVLQLISGLGALGPGAQSGGVAYGAHIGGFIAGLLLIKPFDMGAAPPEPPTFGPRYFPN
jgi:membrane associated rhomboid family serine protease